METEPAARRPIQTAIFFYLACAATTTVSHLPFLRLPYYWDEAGQFVPAALDILRSGHWITQSVEPNVHPPAVMAYLALVWRFAGFDPFTTRVAMLLLTAFALPLTFRLAADLSGRRSGLLAAAMLCCSPLFFAQSMLAQLDAPALVFTALALVLFLEDRILPAVAACVLLVMVKETGAVVPMVFGGWLFYERRRREAVWFVAPLLPLALWITALVLHTGHWAGNADFVHYNLVYLYHPLGIAWRLLRRLYYFFVADFHWVGSIAIVLAWRRGRMFGSRSWRIAALLVAAHLGMFAVVGGAVLERYVLPVVPVVYAAMAAGLSLYRPLYRRLGAALLLGGLTLSNFLNPPYAFPFEENLAFTDFLQLHAAAADYLAAHYPRDCVHTIWPMTVELAYPDLGFVRQGIAVQMLSGPTLESLDALDWRQVQVVALFSQSWSPPYGLSRVPLVIRLRRRFSDYEPGPTEEQARARIPLPLAAHFERRGQWVDVYARPR